MAEHIFSAPSTVKKLLSRGRTNSRIIRGDFGITEAPNVNSNQVQSGHTDSHVPNSAASGLIDLSL